MRSAPLARLVAGGLLAAVLTAPQAAAPLAFDTVGGDAWTFDKHVSGRTDCRQVSVRSPRAEVKAWTGDGRFEAEVPLQAGQNEIRASCQAGGDSLHQPWTVRLEDVPKAWTRARVADGTIVLDAGRSQRAEGKPAPIVRYEWRARPGNPEPLRPVSRQAPLERQPTAGDQLVLQAPKADGEYYVTLRVVDALGRTDQATAMFRVMNGAPVEVDFESEHPAWVDRAVVYGVVPFFFGPRGFDDVSERLDEIAALGATAVWLSPVTASPEDDFGYAVKDYFQLRESFGTEQDFRELVDKAHALGLRVIMDFVPNHFSDQHPYYRHALEHGPRSPYYDWFERGPGGEAEYYFDWENLPNLDYDNAEVQNYIITAFAHWVKHYDIDGFRVDVGWGVRERAPEFWERWREELKRIDPDLFLLAEASARDPFYVRGGFDAVYDWSGKLGEWAWQDVFKEGPEGGIDLGRLRAALTNADQGFAEDTLIFRFLNNNDTGKRFITRYGPAMTRVASTMLFTLPGVPLIYTGDEIGAAFEPYDEGPPLVWRDPYGLTPHYQRLSELRRNTPTLWSDELALIETNRDDAVLAYVRPGKTPRQSVLVMLNFSGEPVAAQLAPTPATEPLLPHGRVRELLSGGELTLGRSSPAIQLPAYGAMVLRRD
jgi:cyclomaltodextrinase